MRRCAHWTAAALLAMILGGCAALDRSGGEEALTWVDRSTELLWRAGTLPGEIIERRRERAERVLTERLVLANDTVLAGENHHTTRLLGERAESLFGDPRAHSRLAAEAVREDYARAFGPWPSELHLDDPRESRYGSYVYATARPGAGVRCVMAWQRIDAEALALPALEGAIRSYRFCAPGAETEALLKGFERMRLAALFSGYETP